MTYEAKQPFMSAVRQGIREEIIWLYKLFFINDIKIWLSMHQTFPGCNEQVNNNLDEQ